MEDEEWEMLQAAQRGIYSGDLLPLAAFLRAGYHLDHRLRRELVHAITGEDEPSYLLKLTKTREGTGNALSVLQTRKREIQMYLYVEESMLLYNNQKEAAVNAAMKKFKVGSTTVTNALRHVRERFSKQLDR